MTKHCQLCNAVGTIYANKRKDTGETIETCCVCRFDPHAVLVLQRGQPAFQPRVPVSLFDPSVQRTPISKFQLRAKTIRRSKVSEVVPG